MKSYKRPYRTYYELWRTDGEIKYHKNIGIPFNIVGYGRVMLRYRDHHRWAATDYGTGLLIGYITVPKPEQMSECVEKFILTVALPKILRSKVYRDKICDARIRAQEVPLLRRYLEKGTCFEV